MNQRKQFANISGVGGVEFLLIKIQLQRRRQALINID